MKSLEERTRRERERKEIVRRAVDAADRIILDGSDGSVEETNWLTSQVARRFVAKVDIACSIALQHLDLA
jgi:hypothetical protein